MTSTCSLQAAVVLIVERLRPRGVLPKCAVNMAGQAEVNKSLYDRRDEQKFKCHSNDNELSRAQLHEIGQACGLKERNDMTTDDRRDHVDLFGQKRSGGSRKRLAIAPTHTHT